jgi:peptidoglycan/xylan/chitin deacetylase (PgdA/CDA1 family)
MAGGRKVAVTLDDIPGVGIPASEKCDFEALAHNTRNLLATLEAHSVPAVGFVTEGNLCDEIPSERLRDLLGLWLDAGMELGNHTFSHPDLNRTSPSVYMDDIVRGERALRTVLDERNQPLRWFRYPQLHAGDDAAVKTEIEIFLAERGYEIAPVTIDNQEYVFANLYAAAKEAGEDRLMGRIVEAYLAHMREVFAFFEEYSVEVVGREIPQVLLLHANALNADHLGEVQSMLEDRGYEYVSLEEALSDPAYALADGYVGPRGLSWLHRWALGKGMEIRMEPREDKYLRDLQQP